jgi:hypothetical protein
LAYELYAEVDEMLHARKLDLLAKHWVIYAEKGMPEETIVLPKKLPEPPWISSVQGAHDAEYSGYDGPQEANAASEIKARIQVRNRSFRTWTSQHPDRPDHLSYHWLDKRGATIIWDGERTALPRDIHSGEECALMFRIKTPDEPGRYILAVDMVQENAAWFSNAGIPWLPIRFRIRKQRRKK